MTVKFKPNRNHQPRDPSARSEAIRNLARTLEKELKDIYGVPTGFFLNAAPIGDGERVADYISNVDRSCGIGWMLETIERFTDGDSIPEPSPSSPLQ